MDLPLSIDQKLHELLRVFLSENERINLSALRTEERCWIGNILDSLAFFDAFPTIPTGSQLLDLGTGGGFPLLPIAVVRPDMECMGLDSIGKKIKAVERIAAALQLSNVSAINGRAEELGRDKAHRERYDIVASRAVAELRVLLEFCSPFAKNGGIIVLWKSLHIEEELREAENAMKELHCNLLRSHRYALPDPFGERQLLIFRKTGQTPATYPRAVGIAKRKLL